MNFDGVLMWRKNCGAMKFGGKHRARAPPGQSKWPVLHALHLRLLISL